jgi:hypothetical protein
LTGNAKQNSNKAYAGFPEKTTNEVASNNYPENRF